MAWIVDSLMKVYETKGKDKGFPLMYMDVQGLNLDQGWPISLISIHHPEDKMVYLLDVQTLKDQAFEVNGVKNRNLQFQKTSRAQ